MVGFKVVRWWGRLIACQPLFYDQHNGLGVDHVLYIGHVAGSTPSLGRAMSIIFSLLSNYHGSYTFFAFSVCAALANWKGAALALRA